MATIFPTSPAPQVNDEYQGYRYNGTTWDIIGVDLTADYQPRVASVSNTELGYLDGVTSSIQTQIGTKLSSATAATTYQPLDSDLTAIAGLTSAADSLPYFTGSGTASLATLTTYGRSLIDDVDAATARTTLGLGTMATAATTNYAALSGATFTGNITAPEVSASTKLVANAVGGDEGGEILLGKPATNTTLAGTGVTIDVFQNRLRIFEQGGNARGGYIDVTKLANGVATNLTPGLVQIIPTSVSVGSGSASVSSNGQVSFDAASSISIDGIFSSTYTSYKVEMYFGTGGASSRLYTRMLNSSGSPVSGNNYYGSFHWWNITNGHGVEGSGNTGPISYATFGVLSNYAGKLTADYSIGGDHLVTSFMQSFDYGSTASNYISGVSSPRGIQIYPSGGTFTGSIQVYGYSKGA